MSSDPQPTPRGDGIEIVGDRPAAASTPALFDRRAVWPLLGLLGVAAAVRVFAWSRTAVLFNDGPVFLAIAEAIGRGQLREVLAHPYHPLYPFAIHGVSALGLGPESAAVCVSILGALLGITALWVLLEQLFDREIAWLGGWLLALHPWAVDFSADVQSDGLYLGLYLASLAGLARMLERPTGRSAIAFAALTLLAYWTRPEALGLFAVAACLFGLRGLRDLRYRERAARPILVAGIVACLGLGPYVGFLSLEAGELTLTQKKSVSDLLTRRDEGSPAHRLDLRLRERRPDPETAPIWLPQSAVAPGAGQPSRDPAGVLEAIWRVVRHSAAALRYEVLAFVLVGGFLARGARTRPDREAFLWLPVMLYSALLVVLVWGAGYVSRRHALPALVPLFGYAAVGWRGLVENLGSRRPFRGHADRASVDARRFGACAALVVVLLVVWGARDLRERRTDRLALRAAAEWIARIPNPVGAVAGEKLRTAYYADRTFVPLRAATDQPLEHALRSAGARWVVVDAARLGRFADLEAGMGRWLRPVHEIERHGHRALVLEIAAAPAR